jgi:hypothetical protein
MPRPNVPVLALTLALVLAVIAGGVIAWRSTFSAGPLLDEAKRHAPPPLFANARREIVGANAPCLDAKCPHAYAYYVDSTIRGETPITLAPSMEDHLNSEGFEATTTPAFECEEESGGELKFYCGGKWTRQDTDYIYDISFAEEGIGTTFEIYVERP